MKLIQSEMSLAVAAAKVGMDEKTAQKYRDLGKLPSQSRQSLAGVFSSPCPETAPPSPDPLADLDLLTENLRNLTQPAAKPPTENHLFQRREKGGKLPANIPLSEYLYEQYLKDSASQTCPAD